MIPYYQGQRFRFVVIIHLPIVYIGLHEILFPAQLNHQKYCKNVALFHLFQGKKVTCVDWSLLDASIVLSGDDGGGIVVWNVVSNSARYLKLFNRSIICIKCSPQQKIAAVSMKTGVMQIFSYESKLLKTLYPLSDFDLSL